MKLLISFIAWLIMCKIVASTSATLSYDDARQEILREESVLYTGGHTKLNPKELRVNEILMKYKINEQSMGIENPFQNAAALHFFKSKSLIEQSSVYKLIQKMPKGADLHLHNTASVSSQWVVNNISYMPGLLRCTDKNGVSILSFRREPKEHDCQSQYVLVSEERAHSLDPQDYDENLEKLINLHTSVPEIEYPMITTVWAKFRNMFATLSDALAYLPAFRAYHWQMLEELYHDNVMYSEIRMPFSELYGINGSKYSRDYIVNELIDIVNRFKHLHSDFLGIKVIYSARRSVPLEEIHAEFVEFKKLHIAYPNFIIGFDVDNQEDMGKPLYDILDAIKDLPITARYFFHAGETNQFGTSTDHNLIDALLLNTTRIGHGYALVKHPVLLQAVKSRGIAIEVSPISNQVLHLVWDMRNHPAAVLLAQDIPIVICNDDPGFWNAKGLSYDYYYALMALAPNTADLRLLKTLVWNSIRYSILNANERRRAHQILEQSWHRFIDEILLRGV